MGTDAERPGPILVHFDTNYLGRLVPVKVDVPRIRSLAEQCSEVLRDLADLHGIRTADAKLERPADWRSKLQGADAELYLLEFLPLQCGEDALVHGWANLKTLRDSDALREEVVRELLVERQVEADCTAADIKGPVFDVGVGLQDFLEIINDLARCIDRGTRPVPSLPKLKCLEDSELKEDCRGPESAGLAGSQA